MSEPVFVQDTTISAQDGYQLAATVFSPPAMPQAAVLICSAAAAPRKVYRSLATYLAQQGFTALTFDYRGTGGSRPATLRGFQTRMRDWAALDVTGAIGHMRAVWPRLDLTLIGHSFGGQALGLAPNNNEVARALLVASQAGYWRLLSSPERYRVYLMLRGFGVPVAHIMGYVPAWAGLGEDLPKGVFLEWVDWVMRPRYFFDDPSLAALDNFARFRGAMRAIGLEDDPWATPEAIDLLVSGFTNVHAERVQVHPRDVGARKIGHFGFFRPAHRDTLWRDAAAWLQGKACEGARYSAAART